MGNESAVYTILYTIGMYLQILIRFAPLAVLAFFVLRAIYRRVNARDAQRREQNGEGKLPDLGNGGHAVLAGIFLLLYGLPYMLLGLLWYRLFFLEAPLQMCSFLLPALAGLFLLLRKPRIAVILMTLAAVIVLAGELPEIPRYLEPEGYLATYDESIGYTEYIPRQFVAVPILHILTFLLFAAALYLRGKPAEILSFCAAAAALLYMNQQLASTAYVTGHPTPLNLLPFFYAVGAIFAGLWRRSLKKTSDIDSLS